MTLELTNKKSQLGLSVDAKGVEGGYVLRADVAAEDFVATAHDGLIECERKR